MKASEVYTHKFFEVTELLNDIRKAVAEHAAPDEEIDRDWGYVGDLGYVAEKLEEVRRFLRNEDEPSVQDVLAQREAINGP